MPDTPRILVPLAEGFEEVEAVALVDVLRRAGLEVVTASLGDRRVEGAHGIRVEADAEWSELDLAGFGALVLPGGMPASATLAADERVLELIRRLEREEKIVAAICAAPLALHAAGVLEGREFTSHPSVIDRLPGAASEARVVASRRVHTSRGPGTALEFALELVEEFVGADEARELESAMCIQRDH